MLLEFDKRDRAALFRERLGTALTRSGLSRAALARVLEDELLPGFASHLSASEFFTPDSFEARFISPLGAGFIIEPRIFQSAYFRPHNVSEEVENLYLVGAGTHPGAGIPSVVTSSEVLTQLVPDAPRPITAVGSADMGRAAE